VRLPFLLSVPHAGLEVPQEVESYCILSPEEIVRDGDEGARAIYDLMDDVAAFVTTDVARAIVDMNRAEDDRRRDGVVKTHTCWNVPVYDPFPPGDVIGQLLDRYHRPYHQMLRELARTGVRMGIDCHTMAATGPPVGPDAGRPRPALCLSTGDGTCPADWIPVIQRAFEDAFGETVALNTPFTGGYIILSHSLEVPWIQLELSRRPFLSDPEKRGRILRALREICQRLPPDGG
jgi:formiminoglutamase